MSKDYVLREEQDRAVNLTMDVMSKEGRKEVLLNAKPRFGKTLTVYNYCQRENLKKILILTNRPVIATSWYNDYVKFLRYADEELPKGYAVLNLTKKGDPFYQYLTRVTSGRQFLFDEDY